MRQCNIYMRERLAGTLTEVSQSSYVFRYDADYLNDNGAPAVALSLPKTSEEYSSPYLFPFFANMLSEGYNRQMQSRVLHIDADDDFGILLLTAKDDTIGAVTVRPIE